MYFLKRVAAERLWERLCKDNTLVPESKQLCFVLWNKSSLPAFLALQRERKAFDFRPFPSETTYAPRLTKKQTPPFIVFVLWTWDSALMHEKVKCILCRLKLYPLTPLMMRGVEGWSREGKTMDSLSTISCNVNSNPTWPIQLWKPIKRGKFATPPSVIGFFIWVTLGLSLRCKLRLVLLVFKLSLFPKRKWVKNRTVFGWSQKREKKENEEFLQSAFSRHNNGFYSLATREQAVCITGALFCFKRWQSTHQGYKHFFDDSSFDFKLALCFCQSKPCIVMLWK